MMLRTNLSSKMATRSVKPEASSEDGGGASGERGGRKEEVERKWPDSATIFKHPNST